MLGCNESSQSGKTGHPSKPRTILDISMRNASSKAIDWVKLEWEGPDVPGGIIPPSTSKTTLGVEWPSVRDAVIAFVDDQTRKRYHISVPLQAINQRIIAGSYRKVTFRILDYEKVEVVCE